MEATFSSILLIFIVYTRSSFFCGASFFSQKIIEKYKIMFTLGERATDRIEETQKCMISFITNRHYGC